MKSNKASEAVILGGGVAGTALGIALSRVGVRSTLVERRADRPSDEGLFLTLAPSGLRVLDDLALLDPLLAAVETVPTPSMHILSATGRSLGVMSAGTLDRGHTRQPSVTLRRASLVGALQALAEAEGVRLLRGRTLSELDDSGPRCQLVLDDGHQLEADLVVGADGLRSSLRARLFPSAPGPRFTGLLNLGGIVDRSGLEPTPGVMTMVWGHRAFFGYTVRPGGQAWWFANLGADEAPGRADQTGAATERWRSELLHLFADDPPPALDLVRATPTLGCWPIDEMPSLKQWWSGRAILVGDAAHAVAPSTGQGASLALEDAAMLARCVRDLPSVPDAFARFQALRQPRARKMLKEGQRRGAYKAPSSSFSRAVRDAMMPTVFKLIANPQLTRWIYDYATPLAAPAP